VTLHFNIMGDWADGYLENAAPDGLGLTAHTDFDWAPAPGTDGIFVFLSDSFVMPANAKRPDATEAWLTVAASKAGQEAFNPVKGSICARTDCDQSLFNEYYPLAQTGHRYRGYCLTTVWSQRFLEEQDRHRFGTLPRDPNGCFQLPLWRMPVPDGVCQ
jgi:ABC-type glycerol-3-phosphate transport system substrate-binding protein